MEKLGRIALLYDLYGGLLTKKQQQALELFYDDDLSLGEIAQLWGTSRQAVHDILKRREKQLEHYDTVLRLVERLQENKVFFQQMDELLQQGAQKQDWQLVAAVRQKLAAKGEDL